MFTVLIARYQPDGLGFIPGSVTLFPLLHSIQTKCGSHLASYAMGNWGWGPFSQEVKW